MSASCDMDEAKYEMKAWIEDCTARDSGFSSGRFVIFPSRVCDQFWVTCEVSSKNTERRKDSGIAMHRDSSGIISA